MDEEQAFRKMIADNLIFYRKRAALTQAEVASRINYSDKSVSKWERADGSPDIYVLNSLAEMYGITLDKLLGDRSKACEESAETVQEEAPAAETREAPTKKHSPFTICLGVGGVWLAATTFYCVCNMLSTPVPQAYLAFIYAIPASFIVVEFISAMWKLPSILHLLFSSGILWTTALCLHLTAKNVANIFLIYVIAAVAQLLGIFALGLYWQMIRVPKYGWQIWRAHRAGRDNAED